MNQDLKSSSHNVNEFNREDEERGLIFKETPLHKVTSWTIYLCPLIFLFVTLILSLVIIGSAHTEKYDETKEALRVLNKGFFGNRAKPLWKKIEFVDFQKDDPTDTNTPKRKIPNDCSSGFTKIPIYHWKGIESGCLCNNRDKHWKSYCWTSSSDQNCKSIDEVSSQNFNVWKKKLACVKLIDSADIKFQQTTCETGWVDCKKKICVKGTLADCPITNLVDGTATAPAGADAAKLVLSARVPAQGSNPEVPAVEFHVVRGVEATPIVDFRASIAAAPCVDAKKYAKLTTGTSYPMLKAPLTGCGQYGDIASYSQKIDSESQQDLYEQNGVKLDLISGFKESFNANDLAQLYYVTQIELGTETVCPTLESHIRNIGDAAEDSINIAFIFSIIILVLSIIGLILVAFYYLGKNLRCKKRYICQGKVPPYVLVFICLVIIILCIVQASIYWSNESAIESNEDKEGLVSSFQAKRCIKVVNNYYLATEKIKDYLALGEIGLFSVVIFLFVWAVLWLTIWIICWAIRKFYLKDEVLRRPE